MALTSRRQAQPSRHHKKYAGHRIIIAKGERVTSLSVHPLFAGLIGLTAAFFAICYLGATGYLIFRDDLINTARVQKVEMRNAYEDRLAAMRIEIDRIASRQMLDQRSVEDKLDRLLGLRVSLDERNATMKAVNKAAGRFGITAPIFAPSPRPNPIRQTHQAANGTIPETAATAYALAATPGRQFEAVLGGVDKTPTSSVEKPAPTKRDVAQVDFTAIEQGLRREERHQIKTIRFLNKKTEEAAEEIRSAMKSLGFNMRKPKREAVGGPYEPDRAEDILAFDHAIVQFEENIERLTKYRKSVAGLPLSRPVKNARQSSNFGRRVDPFLKRFAFHSGIDYAAPTGTPVYATAPGKVVRASWNGGYGRMVEIAHSRGITTRYAHLHKIRVKVGQKVAQGTQIGTIGSTGRSTGPHLHYETRIRSKAKDPANFLKAGRRIADFL
ncbi:MAG: M23 family metallopeptidase [Pseudomonadota bacterium]